MLPNCTRRFSITLLLPLIGLCGCGNNQLPTHKVNGQVKFEDGTTPKFGDIEFYSPKHKINARGKINRDGSFTVTTYNKDDGAVAGKNQIMIMQLTGSYLTARQNSHVKHDHGHLIHPRYNDYRTSGLECTIKEGENNVTLVIEYNPDQTEEGLPHD